MFGNIPFIIEMQDQEAIDIMNDISDYIFDDDARRAQLNCKFNKAGIDIDMLSPRVQDMIQSFLYD